MTPTIIESGDTRFIATPDGGRAELCVPVNGTPTWREAHWENEVITRLCSSRYGIREDRAPVLRLMLATNERLHETEDGRMSIVTI